MTSSRPSRPEARIVAPPRYEPDIEAYGFTRNADGLIVPAQDCPDVEPAKIMREQRYQIDARLWEGRFERGRLREKRVTERLDKEALEGRYRKLRESGDWFTLGDPTYGYGQEGPLTSNYVPLIPGPATRQQYWADYWQSSARCFEASTHSGIAKRACRAMVQFSLGRGVRWQIQDDEALQAWETFWKLNRMRRRMRSIFYDLAVFGEQFLRYFPATANGHELRPRPSGETLIVRQLDPATIYEIVSDQEDLETVFFYHQQFQTRMELYSPPAGSRAPQGRTESGVTRYVIRQIDASEIDHWKVNDVAGEARGRSDLFPALGDLKRLRDLMTSKVIEADIGTRVMGILKAKGTQADIGRVLNSIFPNGQPPPPGTFVGLNDQADLEPFQYTEGRQVRSDFTYDELIDGVVAATGIARPYLGISPAGGSGTTQSTALNQVEPSVKSFEERQDIGDELLHQMFDRVMEQAGINREIEREFIFPEIVKEDRSALLGDLEIAEANDWISKRRAATTAAAQMDFTDYDFDEEQQAIIDEFADADETDGKDDLTGLDKPARGGKIRRPMIRATARQEPKLDPTKAAVSEDQPPGVVLGPDGKPVAGAQPAGAGGMSAAKNPAAKSNTIARESADGRVRRRADDREITGLGEDLARQTAHNLEQLLADLSA